MIERVCREALVGCLRCRRWLVWNRGRRVVDADAVGACEGAGAGLVLKIARCSRLMQIVCVWVFDAERTWSGVWSGVSLGESEVDCIGVGHGSCSVMLVWSARTVCLCLCLHLWPPVWRCDKPWKGKIWGKRQWGLPWCQGKSKGQVQGQGRAGKSRRARGKGRCRGGGGWPRHVLYDVTCHVEVSQSAARTSPRTGQHRLKPCTNLVSASHPGDCAYNGAGLERYLP